MWRLNEGNCWLRKVNLCQIGFFPQGSLSGSGKIGVGSM